jgi:regulatory protein
MPVITDIVAEPRKAGRFAVLVDGERKATLSLDAIERLRLTVGADWERVAPAVEDEGAALATYDRALNMLAFRARSATELRRALVRKQEPPALVDAAIERLKAAGFLDDAQFARQFARSRSAGKGTSKRRLQQELSRKGVAREVGEEAVAEVFDEENIDEAGAAEALARKKLRSLTKVDAQTRNRRLWSFLARRGYDGAQIRRAIEAATSEEVDAVDAADDPEDGEE